jgi:Fur family ferric uptake transcriptional regulator
MDWRETPFYISQQKEAGGWVATTNAMSPGQLRTDAIESACRDRGLRMTGQRRVIARVLGEAEDHPDVVELHRRAATVDDRISLSTVYRTVKLFETEGIIERLEFLGGRSRYERAPQEHHDHLINLATGDVIEFRSEDIEKLQAEIARRLGFRLVSHRLELYAVPLDKNAKKR